MLPWAWMYNKTDLWPKKVFYIVELLIEVSSKTKKRSLKCETSFTPTNPLRTLQEYSKNERELNIRRNVMINIFSEARGM